MVASQYTVRTREECWQSDCVPSPDLYYAVLNGRTFNPEYLKANNPLVKTLSLHGFAQPPYTAMESPFVDDNNQNSRWSATLDERKHYQG